MKPIGKKYWVLLESNMSLQKPTCFLEYGTTASKHLNLTYRLATSECCLTWCCSVKGPFAFHSSRSTQKLLQLCLATTHCKPKSLPIGIMNECEGNTTLPPPLPCPFGQPPLWCYLNNTKEENCRCPTAAPHLKITFVLSQILQLSCEFMLTVQRKAAAP